MPAGSRDFHSPLGGGLWTGGSNEVVAVRQSTTIGVLTAGVLRSFIIVWYPLRPRFVAMDVSFCLHNLQATRRALLVVDAPRAYLVPLLLLA